MRRTGRRLRLAASPERRRHTSGADEGYRGGAGPMTLRAHDEGWHV